MPRAARPRVYVTEAEEQAVRPFVQDIFFAMTDRQRAVRGAVDREAYVAFTAQGLGQALAAFGDEATGEAAAWEHGFFGHLSELKLAVTAARVEPTKGVATFVVPLVSAFRADEEWFFPKGRDWRLKCWLTACFRIVENVRPTVKAPRAAAIFLEHFRDGLARPATVSRPRKSRAAPKPGRRA